MPGADLLFLPLPFAHAARGSGAGLATNGAAPEAVIGTLPEPGWTQPPMAWTPERDAAHRLAMLALQSDRYAHDADYRDAVDAVLAVGHPPTAESETVIASAIGAWMDAADVAETWRKLAEDRGRALRRIAELGDIAAGGLTPGDGLNARLIPGTDPARVSVVADAWRACRMAMVDAGAQVMLDDEL